MNYISELLFRNSLHSNSSLYFDDMIANLKTTNHHKKCMSRISYLRNKE